MGYTHYWDFSPAKKKKGDKMLLKFTHESDQFLSPCGEYCGQFEVTIIAHANADHETDFHYEHIYFVDEKRYVELTDFNESEQSLIESGAETIVENKATELCEDFSSSQLDYIYDSMRDA